MARYIDADKLIDKLEELQFDAPVMMPVMKILNVMELVEDAPTADVVEVVRCKDCKHFGRDMGHGKHDCKKYEMPYCLENDYCSYGEIKNEQNDTK